MKTLKGIEKVIILEKLNSIKKELDELTDFTENVYKSDLDNVLILSEFTYKGYYCTFFKDKNRFIFTYEKNNYVEVCIFKDFEELLCLIINSKLKSKIKPKGDLNEKKYSRKNQ